MTDIQFEKAQSIKKSISEAKEQNKRIVQQMQGVYCRNGFHLKIGNETEPISYDVFLTAIKLQYDHNRCYINTLEAEFKNL
jgi:hypothetical protein